MYQWSCRKFINQSSRHEIERSCHMSWSIFILQTNFQHPTCYLNHGIYVLLSVFDSYFLIFFTNTSCQIHLRSSIRLLYGLTSCAIFKFHFRLAESWSTKLLAAHLNQRRKKWKRKSSYHQHHVGNIVCSMKST